MAHDVAAVQPVRITVPGGREDTVDAKSLAYERMEPGWRLVDDLESTETMRDAKTLWLPREEGEKPVAYDFRLKRSFLFPAFKDTIDKLVAKPFSREIVVRPDEGLPDVYQRMVEDLDLRGNSLTVFARDAFRELVKRGVVHILVTMPDIGGEGASVQRSEMVARDIRPYFVLISAKDLIGWDAVVADGRDVLTEIRVSSRETRPVDRWLEEEWQIVSVISRPIDGEAGTVETWEKGPKAKKFTLASVATHTLPRITLVTLYARQKGLLEAEPPFEDLAWLNVAHWQSSSDHRNLLRYSRVRILAMYGFDDEAKTVVVGGLNALQTDKPPTDAKVEIVKGDNTSHEISESDVRRIEEQMIHLGEQPFTQNTGNITATGRAIDEARSQTDAQMLVSTLQTGLMEAFGIAEELSGEALPADFDLDVFNNFPLGMRASEDAKILTQAYMAGKLPAERWFAEMQRRGLIADTANVEEFLAQLEDGGAQALQAFGGPIPPGEDGGQEDQPQGDAEEG